MKSRPKKYKLKNKIEIMIFLKTFIATFLIVMVVATPIFAQVNKVLEMTPGDEDGPILSETIDFNYLIPSDSPFFDAFTNTNRVNILALGVDDHNLTDTIILASFDIDNKFLDVISIPRDTYYYRGLRDAANNKINAVFRGDPVNSALAVSEILMNIPINYYILLSYAGVAVIIDEIGGVPMDIPFHMRYDDPLDTPPLHIDIKPGPQVLDGVTSVKFLRFRQGNEGFRGYPNADLGRIAAQQTFIKSAIRQSLSLDLPNTIRTTFNVVQSDITIREALYLAGMIIGIDSENMRMHQIPIRGYNYMPDKQGIADMLTEIYSIEPVKIEDDQNLPVT